VGSECRFPSKQGRVIIDQDNRWPQEYFSTHLRRIIVGLPPYDSHQMDLRLFLLARTLGLACGPLQGIPVVSCHITGPFTDITFSRSLRLLDNSVQNEIPAPYYTLSDHTLPVTDIVCGVGVFPHCRVLTASLDNSCKASCITLFVVRSSPSNCRWIA
jgi:hypothetical protein